MKQNEAAGPGGPAAHRVKASGRGPVRVGVVTVSDTRTPETDVNGLWLIQAIEAAGHSSVGYIVVRDEPVEITSALQAMTERNTSVVVFNGGTGVSARDQTVDVLLDAFERELPGFGELFRMLSWKEIGSSAMLSRATAGIFRSMVVFSLPGSHKAVQLGWNALIEPEIEHLAWELVR